jgi:hypothetical protein
MFEKSEETKVVAGDRDVGRFQVFFVAGLFIAAGAHLLWGLGAGLLAWGLTMVIFRIVVDWCPVIVDPSEFEHSMPLWRKPQENDNDITEV